MRPLMNFAIGLLLVASIMIVVEWIARRSRVLRFPRGTLSTDLPYWFLNPLVTRATTPIALALCLIPIMILAGKGAHISRVGEGFGPLSRQPLWLQAVEMLMIGDFLGYWAHRLFHTRVLWRFHVIHHSTRDLYWLSAARLHPINDLLQRVMTVVPLVALGFRPNALGGIVPFLGFYAIVLHADVDWDFGRLRALIVSPRFHRWHHTSAEEGRDRNFGGLLTLWDRLFGTWFMPDRAPTRFGVDDPVPSGLLPQLWYPFSRRAKTAAITVATPVNVRQRRWPGPSGSAR